MPAHLIDAAFEYTFPLHAVARTRYQAVQDVSNPRRHAPNTWQHERQLADHRTRWITAPNNDTLYSNAWVDLSRGPVKLKVGAMPTGRYWSVALMDAFSNHFGMVGLRLDGVGPVDVTLVGPDHSGEAIPGRVIHAPGQDVWLFARCLVDGPEDLPTAHAMQELLSIEPPRGVDSGLRVAPGQPTDPRNYLAVVNEALGRNPPPREEAALLKSWAAIGIQPGRTAAWDELDSGIREMWQDRISATFEALRHAGMRGRRQVQGWITAGPEIGKFGSNFALRASVALGGLGALEPVEAIYFVRFHDDQGQLLDGRQGHVMTVPASGLPTDSFWSFSMYEPVDGQRYFTANAIDRYALGNRTPGLMYNVDGSLDIALTHSPPTQPHLRANWLPAPSGPFQVSLRCYLPRAKLRELRTQMPSCTRYVG